MKGEARHTAAYRAGSEPPLTLSLSQLLPHAFGLALGAAGGLTFWTLGLPLPWMLGALTFTLIAAVCGAPVAGPNRIRPAVVAVIGVMLGARFAPEVLGHVTLWAGSLALLVAYLVMVGLVVVPFYHFAGRLDWPTAYFAGMPGGLTEMIEIGEAKGAKPEPIILAHSLRIVITIALIALWFRVVQGHSVGSGAVNLSLAMEWHEAALLLSAALLGCLMGHALRFPAPTFLGPLALSAGLHLTGISEAAPPGLLVNAAQIVLGTVLGCRFRGMAMGALGRAAVLSIGSTVLSLALALVFALALSRWFGIGLEQGILALAPGGLTEMGLIALAIHADVAFVALNHVVRILVVIVAAPLVFTLLRRR